MFQLRPRVARRGRPARGLPRNKKRPVRRINRIKYPFINCYFEDWLGLTAIGDRDGAREALERRERMCREKGFKFDLQETLEQLCALESFKELKLPA